MSTNVTTTDSYSTETLIRYAFVHEVQNRLKINQEKTKDPNTQAIIDYMENRIKEISQKFK